MQDPFSNKHYSKIRVLFEHDDVKIEVTRLKRIIKKARIIKKESYSAECCHNSYAR